MNLSKFFLARRSWAAGIASLCLSLAVNLKAQPVSPDPAGTNLLESSRIFTAGQNGYHTFRIPALLVTSRGNLLAFCEGRRNSSSDSGDIDLVCRRSTDGGQSWSRVQTIWDDGSNTCGNPCVVVDKETGTICLLLNWNDGEDLEPAIIAQKSKGIRRIFSSQSRDDGITWSTPRDITLQIKPTNWTWYATGPGLGIQIERGPRVGRLVIPCDHIEAETRKYGAHVIYSDDHGETWSLGGSAPGNQVNECEVVELENGRLLLNMRNYDPNNRTRQIAFSADGGETWTDQRHDADLVDPVCQASIRRYCWPIQGRPGVILFSNPASRLREKLTIRASLDDGQTWPRILMVNGGPSAYSCLAALGDGTIGLLYESGTKSPYEGITFARLSTNWFTGPAVNLMKK